MANYDDADFGGSTDEESSPSKRRGQEEDFKDVRDGEDMTSVLESCYSDADDMDTGEHDEYSDYSYSDSESAGKGFCPQYTQGIKRPLEFMEDSETKLMKQNLSRTDSSHRFVRAKTLHSADEKLIDFLYAFAQSSDHFLLGYDSRRVSLKPILREAREKDHYYEVMDAQIPHNPDKLSIDWNGSQHWYLNCLHSYQERTINFAQKPFSSGIRIALTTLEHYDSHRQLLHPFLDKAYSAASHYETMDSPVPHDPSQPVVHDYVSHMYANKSASLINQLITRTTSDYSKYSAISKKSAAMGLHIVAAGLTHYDSRRVSLSEFMQHANHADKMYICADLAAAYADLLVDQPTLDIMGVLQQNFAMHESSCGHSIDLMQMRCSIPRRLALKQKELILHHASSKHKFNAQLQRAQSHTNTVMDMNHSLAVKATSARNEADTLAVKVTSARNEANKLRNEVSKLQTEMASLKQRQQQQQQQLKDKTIWTGSVQGVHWQYDDGGNWHSFDSDAHEKLHKSYIDYLGGGSYTITLTSCSTLREIDFREFIQRNLLTGTRRAIRLLLDAPRSWTTPAHQLLLQTTRTRYMYVTEEDQGVRNTVLKLLSTTGHSSSTSAAGTTKCCVMANVTIKAIYRIEHFALWRKYMHRVRSMREEHGRLNVKIRKVEARKGSIASVLQSVGSVLDRQGELISDVNEAWLFHGTTYDNADSIVRSGFDFRTCDRGMYGKGVYFASESCKSNQYTCSQHTGLNDICKCTGERTMIIARVALGDAYYAKNTLPNQRRPPERFAGHGVYDSIIANPGPMKGHFNGWQHHQEFVIFNMEQAYPSFVVQYVIS